ncbi:Rrf2 family transcriptional regulator [Emcibacteraceae bacterium]|nr:Rrf2 family transcriptional regulator [Emcibacteraceae bacterium]
MRKDNRLPRVLHVLIHLDRHDKLMTSGKIAKMLDTNPVVVRRIMSGLRNKGYVSSSKGAGGGWQLQSQLNEISLYDVHMALGEPELLSLGSGDNPNCLVEQSVDIALKTIMTDIDIILKEKLRNIKVSDIASDFDLRLEEYNNSKPMT